VAKKKERKMKDEIINSIDREINQQNRTFQEQVVMKELNENGVLLDLYRCYKEKIFPRTGKQEFAAIYSHTVIFVLLGAALFSSNVSFRQVCVWLNFFWGGIGFPASRKYPQDSQFKMNPG
jgi:hypothetical protein